MWHGYASMIHLAVGADDPRAWIFYYGDKLTKDLFVATIQNLGIFDSQVLASQSKLHPCLGFGGFTFRIIQLANKCRLITTLAPGFADVCTNGTRRTSDLVCERVGLFFRKALR